ncbi:tRNA (adenosine(37)-N6)-dimethylallyltransferase MiaA [Hirschia litorea]|uniref:tRNA dimethylallyltransferase n=1 Tax=Hirschia litorea TaxID=1199156 RepID=A0ABW2ILI1_9PROT
MRTAPAILIHGPTASGKTDLSIALAKELDGEIINADAMQVYKDLSVLSARPSAEEIAQAPHHMFGHVDGAERYSTGLWLKDACAQIEDIRRRGKVPILAGGTGLYLSALVHGLSKVPDVPEEIKREVLAKVEADRAAAHAELARVDADAAARIKPLDIQRLTRALEVYYHTGKPITSFQTPEPAFLKQNEWVGFALTPIRKELYARIEARFDRMLETGAPDEARILFERKLPADLPIMRAHGMPGFCEFFEEKVSLEEAIERGKRDTRRYAKRQFTWIAHQFPTWTRIPSKCVEVRKKVICSIHHAIDAAN